MALMVDCKPPKPSVSQNALIHGSVFSPFITIFITLACFIPQCQYTDNFPASLGPATSSSLQVRIRASVLHIRTIT